MTSQRVDHLRRITAGNEKECLELRVDDTQARFTNAKSLAVCDRAARGYPQPRVPTIGFVMYEIDCGAG